ncbi:metal ABC transporter substrate-binding protein [Ruicaihuangia caeni]|uniref:Metal ABC transporter substrate-binding protein n=1 Tax=Ruicaihuangia caeni TaxID=3042517 RepID=A0AAW6TAS6_9MICO|nr:metal ABC transporter substrate-binding protein [Klugiella sp. YN-L-19]MDI2099068.1 metal ABC transporter substrate-binding protein [Klugiella sp. YN-L-19]
MNLKRPLAALGTAVVAVLGLVGCSTELPGRDTGLSIVVTTTQLGDLTREVAGDDAAVTQLLKPNTSAHSFDPSAADLLALSRADVLVMNGAGLEPWLEGAISASGFDGQVFDASHAVALREGHDDHDHGHDTDHGHDDDHGDSAADSAEHDEHEGHADAAADGAATAGSDQVADPHLWTSIRNAIRIVDELAHTLEALDAPRAEAYIERGHAYAHRLEALDEWTTEQIDRVPAEQRLIVSNHDSLGYFNADYGITYVGAVIPSFDDSAELSASDIDALVAAIRASGAKAVFAEASLSPKAAETIAREAGVRVFAGADALYVDSLGPAGSPAGTYIGAQVHNVERILQSWGVEAAPPPAEVRE